MTELEELIEEYRNHPAVKQMAEDLAADTHTNPNVDLVIGILLDDIWLWRALCKVYGKKYDLT